MALPLATAIPRGRRKDDCATSEMGAAAVQTAGAAGRETMGEAMDSWRVAQDAQGISRESEVYPYIDIYSIILTDYVHVSISQIMLKIYVLIRFFSVLLYLHGKLKHVLYSTHGSLWF